MSLNWNKDQTAIALTRLDSSSKRGMISSIKLSSPELPAAISTFLKNLFLPIRFILVVENNFLKLSSSNFKKLFSFGLLNSLRGKKSSLFVFFAYLFVWFILTNSFYIKIFQYRMRSLRNGKKRLFLHTLSSSQYYSRL